MKGSAVAQSFKALASKINNQVPLGPTESNRLLTALTSSFRKHLDEVHPSQLLDDGKRPSAVNQHHKSDRHDFQSSAALADKHLASVLTNPLLVKTTSRPSPRPALDEITAQAEMDNGADPLGVLESYHEQQHASLEVALTCLRHLRRSIKNLPHDEQVAKVKEAEAGKRILSWLWGSKHMKTQAFVDNQLLQDAIVWFAMMEDQEEFLWKWLHSDVELPLPEVNRAQNQHLDPNFMWKSRILYAMVMTRLGSPHQEAGSADAALEIYFRAVQSFHEENASVTEKLVLSNRAKIALIRALTRKPGYPNTSPFLYDRFIYIRSNENLTDGHQPALTAAWNAYNRGLLMMWHPTSPSADLWFKTMTEPVSEGLDNNPIWDHHKTDDSESARKKVFYTSLRAAELLKLSGKLWKSAKIISTAKELLPEQSKDIGIRWHRISKRLDERNGDAQEKQKTPPYAKGRSRRSPNWLSQYFPATG